MLKASLNEQTEGTGWAGVAASRVRGWLRRVMPRLALAAPALVLVWVFLANSRFDETPADNLLDTLIFLVVLFTALYFGLRALRWLTRKLLWRVRRRLIVTYTFIGLTPLVLFGILGLLSSWIFSAQATSRIVSVQVGTTQSQALASAHALADAYAALPPAAAAPTIQRWLDERAALLQGSLPGVRLSLWRGSNNRAGVVAEDVGSIGHGGPAEFVSAPAAGEEFQGVGGEADRADAPLPEWLKGHADWSGFAFMPPESPGETFGAPSMRALVRRAGAGRGLALLLVVPVNRALIRRYRESSGVDIKPFFVSTENISFRADGKGITVGEDTPERERERLRQKGPGGDGPTLDQFGEPVSVGGSYAVFLPATDWPDGGERARLAFLFSFSWLDSVRQLVASSVLGEALERVLIATAIVFLVFELMALFFAAWMTRAVTGTVHKLYRATQLIKSGDFSHRIHADSHDQLGELALAFNEMSANVEALLVERVERERLEREVEIAAEVQAQLFPRSVPRLSSAEITGECRAARGVAGDYYDYDEVEPGLIAFALGDVSGKGVSASLVMSNLQAALRAQITIIAERLKLTGRVAAPAAVTTAGVDAAADATAPCGVTGIDTNCAVEEMAASINRQLCRSTDDNRFVTLFLALYDDRARSLRYTNAGHNEPILVRAGGAVERLSAGGTIVGAFEFATYEESQTSFAPGDLLVIFSDGLSEAQNVTGEEYGEERLARFAAEHRDETAADLRRLIFEEVDAWSGDSERGDDQTLVILKGVADDE